VWRHPQEREFGGVKRSRFTTSKMPGSCDREVVVSRTFNLK
jgi:hypothetical protein